MFIKSQLAVLVEPRPQRELRHHGPCVQWGQISSSTVFFHLQAALHMAVWTPNRALEGRGGEGRSYSFLLLWGAPQAWQGFW